MNAIEPRHAETESSNVSLADAGADATPTVDDFRGPLLRYFSSLSRMQAFDLAFHWDRTPRDWSFANYCDPVAVQEAEARDELIALVRRAHGIAPDGGYPFTMTVEVDGTILVIPANSGGPDHSEILLVIHRSAILSIPSK
jgi:hypothetical protein